jgi:ATP/maltotriose-dependent transcriptional regulator MalT
LAVALNRAGRCEDALRAAEQGIQLTERTEDPAAPWGPVELEAGRCGAHALAGRLDVAEALARDGYDRALSSHWPSAKAVHAFWLGTVALTRGRVRTAARWLGEAAELVKPAPVPFLLALLGQHAVARALAGDLASAESLLREGDTALSETTSLFAAWTQLSRCWVAAARGETTQAVTLAVRAADLARERGHHEMELTALHDVVRLDAAALVHDRLTGVARRVQGELAPVYAAHARARLARDGRELDAVAGRFAAIGAILLAAEAAAHAAGAHEFAGRKGSGLASANRALVWAEQCEGARTPALVRLRVPGDLTKRELEIAQLASSGLTSRTIAERLVVSVRTVDNVLRSVYAKLGLAGRGELGEALGIATAVAEVSPPQWGGATGPRRTPART